MTIIRWEVSAWSYKPLCKKFERETVKCYFDSKGRRYSKNGAFTSYFETEAEALEHIKQRRAREDERKRVDLIKAHGPQLLEALEGLLDCMRVAGWSDDPMAVQARAVIANAKGQ